MEQRYWVFCGENNISIKVWKGSAYHFPCGGPPECYHSIEIKSIGLYNDQMDGYDVLKYLKVLCVDWESIPTHFHFILKEHIQSRCIKK